MNNIPEESGHNGADPQAITAKAPVFVNATIAAQYYDGLLPSRLDADLADVWYTCEQKAAERAAEDTQPIPLSPDTLNQLTSLNSLVLLQNGEILPILDIERMGSPATLEEKIRLYHAAARTLLDAVQAILEDREALRQELLHDLLEKRTEQEDDNGEGGCHAPL